MSDTYFQGARWDNASQQWVVNTPAAAGTDAYGRQLYSNDYFNSLTPGSQEWSNFVNGHYYNAQSGTWAQYLPGEIPAQTQGSGIGTQQGTPTFDPNYQTTQPNSPYKGPVVSNYMDGGPYGGPKIPTLPQGGGSQYGANPGAQTIRDALPDYNNVPGPATPLPTINPWPSPPGGPAQKAFDAESSPIFAALKNFLKQYGLPDTLLGFIKESIAEGWEFDQIILELRNRPEYKARFPEYEERAKKGLSTMNEGEILEYRSRAKSLLRAIRGTEPDQNALKNLIVNDISLAELEHRATVFKSIEEAPWIRAAIETHKGQSLSDDELYDFMDPLTKTPELDRDYRDMIVAQRALFNTGGGSVAQSGLQAIGLQSGNERAGTNI